MTNLSSPRPLTAFALFLILCICCVSCSDSKTDDDKTPGTSAAQAKKTGTGPSSTNKTVKKPKDKFNRDKLYELMTEAKKTYETGDFKAAAKKFADAARMAQARPRREQDNLELAKRMKKRCDVFTTLLTDVSPPTFSDRKRIYRFTMMSGRKFIAKVLRRDGDRIKVLKENGTGGTLVEEDIFEEDPLDVKDYNKHLLETLHRDEEEAGKQKNYFTLYNCVYFAAQHKLIGEITRLLDQTFSLSGSEDLLSIFCPDDYVGLTSNLLESYGKEEELLQFRLARGLAQVAKPDKTEPDVTYTGRTTKRTSSPPEKPDKPETPKLIAKADPERPSPRPKKTRPKPSQDAGERDGIERHGKTIKTDDRPDITAAKKVRAGTGALASKPAFIEAQKLLNVARIAYRNSMPGRPDAAKHAKRAQKLLERAIDLVNPLLDKYPDNYELGQVGQQISYLLHAIIKNRGL
jgi:hypothetical protein